MTDYVTAAGNPCDVCGREIPPGETYRIGYESAATICTFCPSPVAGEAVLVCRTLTSRGERATP